MEAATLKKKSAGLSKGKLKKTIKNVLCRPDSIHWPVISEENENSLRTALNRHKVEIPDFKKPQWNVLKNIPKEQRPKPPPVEKPDGLIFGLRHCSEAVGSKACSAVIIDSEVNPRSIVEPVVELCFTANVPVICLKKLKELSVTNFGFKTACLGIKNGCLEEVSNLVTKFAKTCAPPIKTKTICSEDLTNKAVNEDIEMSEIVNRTNVTDYLLKRTSKKSRVFIPPSDTEHKEVKKFTGQDYIVFSGNTEKKKEKTNESSNTHCYKNMKVKRIMNNPNRQQMGKKRKTENAK